MNKKAEKFSERLKELKEDQQFQIEEIKDELQTVVYRSSLEVGGQRLPVVVIIDQSIFVIVRIVVANNCLTEKSPRAKLEHYINELNGAYKIFKYYIRENTLVLDMSLPAAETGFEPDLIRAALDLAIKHLGETFPATMEVVWNKK